MASTDLTFCCNLASSGLTLLRTAKIGVKFKKMLRISKIDENFKHTVSNDGKWPQAAARGLKWPQVASSDLTWPLLSNDRKWPQVASSSLK